jgi:hypothetical protein
MTLDETLRKALFLAVPILEKMPDTYRPDSNIEDMREILAGRSTGRDGLIIMQALAMALAYRTSTACNEPMKFADGDDFISEAPALNRRLHEFSDLFAAVAKADPWSFAVYFSQACDQIAAARQDV